jgi:hypothetical protein
MSTIRAYALDARLWNLGFGGKQSAPFLRQGFGNAGTRSCTLRTEEPTWAFVTATEPTCEKHHRVCDLGTRFGCDGTWPRRWPSSERQTRSKGGNQSMSFHLIGVRFGACKCLELLELMPE